MADLPVVDPLSMTLEEYVQKYIYPVMRQRLDAAADEFDRKTKELLDQKAK